ncbi:hypothetical protein P3G55_07575 [Leptospira sp. 96542]|nr:hypothetical protein [Leptospira sp. 96542]
MLVKKFLFKGVMILGFLSSINCIGSHVSKDIQVFDSATIVRSTEYQILGTGTGQDSSFYLLGMFPVTKAPSVELALSQVMEKFPEGKTLINIRIQREDRAYFPLGLVTVLTVKADVVGDPNDNSAKFKETK